MIIRNKYIAFGILYCKLEGVYKEGPIFVCPNISMKTADFILVVSGLLSVKCIAVKIEHNQTLKELYQNHISVL